MLGSTRPDERKLEGHGVKLLTATSMGLSDGHKALLGRKEGEPPVSGCEGTRGECGQGFKVSSEFFILIRPMEVSGERTFDREGSEGKRGAVLSRTALHHQTWCQAKA